ncbi:ribonuclease H-like domain-containing protein [Mycena rebaudengoi]|nr:ribonuclease H-like domain-containing protein [Mycena rebaudengoi]
MGKPAPSTPALAHFTVTAHITDNSVACEPPKVIHQCLITVLITSSLSFRSTSSLRTIPKAHDNPLWNFFWEGKSKVNSSHWETWCKGCVRHHENLIKQARIDDGPVDAATQSARKKSDHEDARVAAGVTPGTKDKFILHILGGKGIDKCPYVTVAATTEASKQRTADKEAKNAAPAAALQSQALRAIISTNSAFRLFEDPEMLALFGMMRSCAPDIMPSRKVIGECLLNEAAQTVEEKLARVLKDQNLGLSADGWKSLKKDAVNAVCANVDYKSYTLELVDITAEDKGGPGMAKIFADIIDRMEAKYGCVVVYFITDADGGSKKGRIILGKERIYLILPSCWAHQVRTIFNDVQAAISLDRNGSVLILAYLVANMTRWTTHCIAFMRLFRVEESLVLGVMQSRGTIIKAQVGRATGAEKAEFTAEANMFCDLIMDKTFWSCLESLIGDIEPICYGTNINQKDSTRADQVLLSLAGMFLRMVDHPESDVAAGMTKRLEKRWKDCDQPLFLLALILNPFEQLSCFGPKAALNHFNCLDLVVSMYKRLNKRPHNTDTAQQRRTKELQLSAAFLKYLSHTGVFSGWKENEEVFEQQMVNPIAVWVALRTPEIEELADFAILLLQIVVNQAGCERVFSDLKIKQTQRRNRLKLEKLEKMTKIGSDIKTDHRERGLIKLNEKRKVHKSTAALLTVPWYRDAVQDDDESDETGSVVVKTASGWRGAMSKWIADAQAAEDSESEDDEDDVPMPTLPKSKWKRKTLAELFGGVTKVFKERLTQAEIEAEAELMADLATAEAEADAEEDGRPDDGEIEINSDEEYKG